MSTVSLAKYSGVFNFLSKIKYEEYLIFDYIRRTIEFEKNKGKIYTDNCEFECLCDGYEYLYRYAKSEGIPVERAHLEFARQFKINIHMQNDIFYRIHQIDMQNVFVLGIFKI